MKNEFRSILYKITTRPIYQLALFTIFLFGCSDEDIDIAELRGTIVEGATVSLSCEYIFQTDGGRYYVPTFLPAQYKQNGALVFIKGEILNELSDCANLSGDGQFIRIEQISAAN
tara:strand:- start:101 stop:445 length:345 start_codon:yes stop_codon:yes gene_type:complete